MVRARALRITLESDTAPLRSSRAHILPQFQSRPMSPRAVFAKLKVGANVMGEHEAPQRASRDGSRRKRLYASALAATEGRARRAIRASLSSQLAQRGVKLRTGNRQHGGARLLRHSRGLPQFYDLEATYGQLSFLVRSQVDSSSYYTCLFDLPHNVIHKQCCTWVKVSPCNVE